MPSLIEEFEASLPTHKASLHLTHNQHLAYYQTVEEYLTTFGDCQPSFPSEADRVECDASNELWELQWYPDTPIGSYSIAASTLPKLMAFAKVALDD